LSAEKEITINGERRALLPGTTLLSLVRELELAPERLAIEVNRAIIKREMWETTPVDGGAEIEIVQFVGGG
jgi:thiamine biosynthesis protein ThiS